MSFLGGLVSSLGAGLGNKILGGDKVNETNSAISQKQMDFQERMRNTSYQAATKDMRAAGLNPMLAYSQGGASVPGGAGIPAVDTMKDSINSAMAAARLEADLEQVGLQNEVLKDQSENLRSQTTLNDNNAQTALNVNRKAAAEADIAQIDATIANSALGTIQRVGSAVSPFISSSKSLAGLFENAANGANAHVDPKTGEITNLKGGKFKPLPVKKR